MKDDLAELKIKLRKLYNRYPAEFEQIVEQLERMAIAAATLPPDPDNDFLPDETAARLNWVLPPIDFVRGKPAKVWYGALIGLLVDYRYARANGVSREEFLHQTAEGRWLSNSYSSFRLTNADTVAGYLKMAEKKAKGDADFATLVEKELRSLLQSDDPFIRLVQRLASP
jgi:hypothetical protein